MYSKTNHSLLCLFPNFYSEWLWLSQEFRSTWSEVVGHLGDSRVILVKAFRGRDAAEDAVKSDAFAKGMGRQNKWSPSIYLAKIWGVSKNRGFYPQNRCLKTPMNKWMILGFSRFSPYFWVDTHIGQRLESVGPGNSAKKNVTFLAKGFQGATWPPKSWSWDLTNVGPLIQEISNRTHWTDP